MGTWVVTQKTIHPWNLLEFNILNPKSPRFGSKFRMMFLFHVSKFSGSLAGKFFSRLYWGPGLKNHYTPKNEHVATCQEAHLPPLSHHTAKASGMVSVDLREFGAFVFVLFFGVGENTSPELFLAWGKKISALTLGQNKNLDRFVDDFCVLLQQPKLIVTDFWKKYWTLELGRMMS